MITLYHLRDWYGKGKQERNNKTTKMPYSNLWAMKQQRHNAETKAPPSQEPRDHRVQAARATFSQILGHDPKASNDTAMWQMESRNWCCSPSDECYPMIVSQRELLLLLGLRGRSHQIALKEILLLLSVPLQSIMSTFGCTAVHVNASYAYQGAVQQPRVDPPTVGHMVWKGAPPAAPGACVGPCFCVVFAFLAWLCTGRSKHTNDSIDTATYVRSQSLPNVRLTTNVQVGRASLWSQLENTKSSSLGDCFHLTTVEWCKELRRMWCHYGMFISLRRPFVPVVFWCALIKAATRTVQLKCPSALYLTTVVRSTSCTLALAGGMTLYSHFHAFVWPFCPPQGGRHPLDSLGVLHAYWCNTMQR